MPRKTPSKRLILWDGLHVSLYGPSDIRNARAVRGSVRDLLKGFGEVVTKCTKDRARQIPVLNHFQVRVQS